MSKIYFNFIFLSTISFGQIGINKEASSPLDIKKSTINIPPITIKNNSNVKTFEIGTDNSLYFKNRLNINNTPGENENVLISNGANQSPKWDNPNQSNINKDINRYVLTIFYGEKIDNTPTFSNNANTDYRLQFFNNETFFLKDEYLEISTFENGRAYKILKEGIYDIIVTANVKTEEANANTIVDITTANYLQKSAGSISTLDPNFSTITIGSTRYLKKDEYIYLDLISDSNWKFDFISVLINYSNKTTIPNETP